MDTNYYFPNGFWSKASYCSNLRAIGNVTSTAFNIFANTDQMLDKFLTDYKRMTG